MSTGSFPLLDLADAYGLDYGDVLLLADWFRARCVMQPLPPARARECSKAQDRIWLAMPSVKDRKAFCRRLDDHAKTRWGTL